MDNPFKFIKSRYITEKSTVLEQLQDNNSNRSVARCKLPKYVFLVDINANKRDIAAAIELIYREQEIKVTRVNTLVLKPKKKRRGKGRLGATARVKKAIVTLEEGDRIDNV